MADTRQKDEGARGNELYRCITSRENEYQELTRKIWSVTPWMHDVWTDRIGSNRWHSIRQWCLDHVGPEANPIHEKPGLWQFGCATMDGYTWMGFATEEHLNFFLDEFGADALLSERSKG